MDATSHSSMLDARVPARAAARLRSYRREAEDAMSGRIEAVILFGSRARGDARRGSDYDVAIFVRDLQERRSVDDVLSNLAYRHMVAGVHIRPVALPASLLRDPAASALTVDIARDGIVVG